MDDKSLKKDLMIEELTKINKKVLFFWF